MSLTRLMSRKDPNKRLSLLKKEAPKFRGDLYPNDEKSKKPSKEESAHVTEVNKGLEALGLPLWGEERILRVLRGGYANGNAEKAIELINLWEDASIGLIKDWSSNVPLVGAENNGKVTCYLDSLLFALYAHLDSFEAMLYNVFDDDKRKRLSSLLRLFVNMLRSGKLVTTDIMQQIQNSLAECGWKDAAKRQQQDASEAFTFIAETLEMPLLTLKMDIAHGGLDIPDDDHKFINERLLNVAIPSEHEVNGPVTLERCLEDYFNNRVDVQRKLEQRVYSAIDPLLLDEKPTNGIHMEYADLGSSPSTPLSPSPISIERTTSLFRTVSKEKEINGSSKVLHGVPKTRRRASSLRKEITIPAWQFFNLLPFYTDCNTDSTKEKSTTKSSFANHFSSKRPIIGLCLKRYTWTAAGTPIRNGVEVKIPTEIELPHFVGDDDMEDSGNFRLLLQSAVCHRGTTVNAGHYISLVRGDGDKWLRFDDLAKERIVEVDREKAFSEESPYLLFYQVQAMEGPPPYEEFESTRSSTEESRPVPTFDFGDFNGNDSNHTPSSTASSPSISADTGDSYLSLQGRASTDISSLRPSSRSESREEPELSKRKSRSASRTRENRLSFVGLSKLTSRRSTKDEHSTNGNGQLSTTSSLEDHDDQEKSKKKERRKSKRRDKDESHHDDNKECIIQ